MIKVLIVDDSKVVQEFMTYLLSSDPEIEIVGIAGSGEEAVQLVSQKKPDVITMDIHMPGMNGYEATRTIMESTPTPIVIVSGSSNEIANSFQLIEAGALAMILRPPGVNYPEFELERLKLLQLVKLMSEVKVVKRFPKRLKSQRISQFVENPVLKSMNDIQLIAIGASTGGPLVLLNILSKLPNNLPVPVLIVQHIAKGFLQGFRDWLASASTLPINIAQDGEELKAATVYLAPDDFQMAIGKGLKIHLDKNQTKNGLCPSVDYLFRSVHETYAEKSIGVLLTGMGKDGAKELKNMKDKGAITMVQNEESCVIFGMPGEAIKIGAATHILTPDKIAETLIHVFNSNKK